LQVKGRRAAPALLARKSRRGMMRQYELVERVTRYNPHADENLLNKA
jgi:hypothetical protein